MSSLGLSNPFAIHPTLASATASQWCPKAVKHFMVASGCALDDPIDADVPATGRLRNFVCEGHADWRPPSPLVFGFEF